MTQAHAAGGRDEDGTEALLPQVGHQQQEVEDE